MARKNKDINVKINLHYPYSDKFEYETFLDRINLDTERENDIKSGRGFAITSPQTIKKDIKDQDGIFSSRYGSGMQDVDPFASKYRCKCGMLKGVLYHGMKCDNCGTICKYVDDDMLIFGWIVIRKDYYIIHPNMYKSLEAFIGATRLEHILETEFHVDVNGKVTVGKSQKEVTFKKDEKFRGIGMLAFKDRFDEIMNFYLAKYPNKKQYYDDIYKYRDIVFTKSVPVFTTLLRPSKYDNASLKYEKTNEDYNLINKCIYKLNSAKLRIFVGDNGKNSKHILKLLTDTQRSFNAIYDELREILSHKKGELRSSIGGRYDFSARSVIAQGTDLKPYQVRLSYHCLCELLQQVIINILVRTYSITYADAYKKWYKAQIGYSQIVYDIINGLIKDSKEGLPVIINRNPTINYDSVLSMKCIGINKDFTMSIPLAILKKMGADFDGDTLNILYMYNKDFIEASDATISPKIMFISKNDGMCDPDLLPARDTIINANGMKSLCKYTEQEINDIKRLQLIE